jgi:hypothetical protein
MPSLLRTLLSSSLGILFRDSGFFFFDAFSYSTVSSPCMKYPRVLGAKQGGTFKVSMRGTVER